MENKVIKKANSLVEGMYDLSLWEMRLILKMLSLIKKEDQDFQEYTIDLKEFKKDFNLEQDGSAYRRIRAAADVLMEKVVIIRKKLANGIIEESKVNIITDYTRPLNRSTYIKMSFHPKMKPYLIQLKSEFLRYDAKNILQLPTPYSIRLYELAKQYQKIGQRIMSLDEIKKMLRLENKYKQYAHLRQRVINPSVDYINLYTDINLRYSEIKQSRKVVKLQFTIAPKPDVVAPHLVEVAVTQDSEPKEKDALKNDLLGWGIRKELLVKWRTIYDDDYIRTRMEYVKKQDGVVNPGAYLNTIIDKEILVQPEEKMSFEQKLKIVKGMLYSREGLERKIINKHGQVSEKALVAIVVKMFPDKFK